MSDNSLAQNRPRRVRKAKKFDDESPPNRKKIDEPYRGDTQSTPNSAKRKQDIVELPSNGRAARSKTRFDADIKRQNENKDVPTVADEAPAPKLDESTRKLNNFIETLKNKSSASNDMSIEGKHTNLKITTWNINGVRAWLTKQGGMKFIRDDDADIFCFQETKCGNSKVPVEIKNVPNYRCYFNGSDDGRAGVICLSKKAPLNVTNGIGIEVYDIEARVITMEYDDFFIVNVYVPNSGQGLKRLDFRMKWDADFLAYLRNLDKKKPVIVCGDLNVSHHEIDLANPKTNLKTAGFTIGERNNFSKLLDETQLVDIFRLLNPGKPACYTYWSYMKNAREKNIGWRLDYFLLSRRWVEKTCDVVIRSDIQGSDHCPVTIYLSV